MPLDDSLISMFHSEIGADSPQDEAHIEVPMSELNMGPLGEGETYRIAILGPADTAATTSASSESTSRSSSRSQQQPPSDLPVTEGETVDIEIEDLGSEGDGIAKVDGYAVIVPGASVGQELTVKVNHTTDTHAFAEPIVAHSESLA